ncbi:MAG: LacI family DNA-binding transcriptional regulator [Steroidobacteraceae bacterium]
MNAPTIRDVAARAGTTPATVSRALNGTGYVSAAKRRAVLDAAAELGYIPHASAQLLRSTRSRLLAVIVGDLENPRSTMLINGVQKLAGERGYTTFFASVADSGGQSEQDVLRVLLRQRPEGLILATLRTPPSDQFLHEVASRGLPVSLVGRDLEQAGVDSISANYRRGGETITGHLLELGHRRIAFLGAQLSEADRIGRLRGYLDALQRARIQVRPAWVIGDAEQPSGPRYPTHLTGYQGVQRLLQLSARPTAIVARNDVTAVGAIQALKDAGLRVPGDVSVTGFDNIPLAGAITPALTTMSQPTEEEGNLAAEFLIARLERPQETIPPRAIVLECNLIVRASTAALPRQHRRSMG